MTSAATRHSNNTALERSGLFTCRRRTHIGSSFVIAAMTEELATGSPRVGGKAAGWPPARKQHHRRALGNCPPLPTRDAVLAIPSIMSTQVVSVSAQFAGLPQLFTFSDRSAPPLRMAGDQLLVESMQGDPQARLALQTRPFGSFAGAVASFDLTDDIHATFEGGAVIYLRQPAPMGPNRSVRPRSATRPRLRS